MKFRKKEESGEAANVLFASFSDSEKEVGCGATPHCCRARGEKERQ